MFIDATYSGLSVLRIMLFLVGLINNVYKIIGSNAVCINPVISHILNSCTIGSLIGPGTFFVIYNQLGLTHLNNIAMFRKSEKNQSE